MLDSVLFVLPTFSHVIDILQVTHKHLSRDLMFVTSDGIIQTNYILCGKVPLPFCILSSE